KVMQEKRGVNDINAGVGKRQMKRVAAHQEYSRVLRQIVARDFNVARVNIEPECLQFQAAPRRLFLQLQRNIAEAGADVKHARVAFSRAFEKLENRVERKRRAAEKSVDAANVAQRAEYFSATAAMQIEQF